MSNLIKKKSTPSRSFFIYYDLTQIQYTNPDNQYGMMTTPLSLFKGLQVVFQWISSISYDIELILIAVRLV
jgi:hypothetical protein